MFAVSIIALLVGRADQPLVLEASMPIAVEGRIDHLVLEPRTNELFVAALGHGSLEVLDVARKQVVRSIKQLLEPQGVALLPDLAQLAVASGGDGSCRFYDLEHTRAAGMVDVGGDADNVRFDAKHKRLYVGYGDGALAVIDAAAQKKLNAIELGAHPESFQLEANGPRVFVNVPGRKQVAVVDRERGAVIATWPLNGREANYPMAFDESAGRLFVACRKPARLLAFAVDSGKIVADVECSGDADDVFLDAARKRVYVSCGEGFIDVFARSANDALERTAQVATASGARTCLYAADRSTLYLAVPHRQGQRAEIRAYAVR
ncbi:MAG: hypothetical protein U1E76_05840 [Planctomycetota bacterium]